MLPKNNIKFFFIIFSSKLLYSSQNYDVHFEPHYYFEPHFDLLKIKENTEYKLNFESEVFLLKCPLESLRTTKNITFDMDDELFNEKKVITNVEADYFWCIYEFTSIDKKRSYKTINFGKLNVIGDETINSFEWTIKLKNSKSVKHPSIKNVFIEDIYKNEQKECGEIILTKDVDGKIKKVSGIEESNFFNGQVIYFYYLNVENKFLTPCEIWQLQTKLPSINLPNIITKNITNKIQINNNNIEILAIQKDIIEQIIQISIDNKMNFKNYEYFNKYEKIVAKRMIFSDDNTFKESEIIPVEENNFVMKDFGTIKLEYKCTKCMKKGKKFELLLFFKPHNYDSNDFVLKYFDGTIQYQPKCDLKNINLGYLIDMSVMDGNLVSLKLPFNNDNKNFKQYKDSIIYLNTTFISLHKCTYMTPDGEYSINFVSKDTDKSRSLTPWRNRILHQNDDNNTIGILFLLLILFSICGLVGLKVINVKKEQIKEFLITRKLKSNYSNIWTWWYTISNKNLKDYLEIFLNENNQPSKNNKMKNERNAKDGGKINNNSCDIYSNYLVESQKKNNGILAYNIYQSDSFNGLILSQSPNNNKISDFWNLIYQESIDILIPIHFDNNSSNEEDNLVYWPKTKEIYGNISVEYVKTFYSTMKNITGLIYNLKCKKKSSTVTIFYIKGWKLYEIPNCFDDIIQLYDEIYKMAPYNKTLIHSSYGSDSTIYYYTYFCIIIDTFFNKKYECDPLKIIKNVRKKRYGGKLSGLEYAYVFNAIVKYFVDKQIIIDGKGYKKINESYNKYLHKMTKIDCRNNVNLKNFLHFINILDEIKLDEICHQMINESVLHEESIKSKCQKFNQVIQYEKRKKNGIIFNKYPFLYCLDNHSVSGGDYNISGTDVVGYINANQINYNLKDGTQRKLIMCQAPTSGTMNGVLDMYFKQKISIVAILLNDNEIDSEVMPYLTKRESKYNIDNYEISVLKIQNVQDSIKSVMCKIKKPNEEEISVKFYIYKDWSNKNIPTNSYLFNSFYRYVMDNKDNKKIVIHCDSGIIRTGILAFLIYSIDNISSSQTFNLIRNLGILRSHRYGIIPSSEQLLYVLQLIILNFANDINEIDSNVYNKVTKMLQKYEQKKDKNIKSRN